MIRATVTTGKGLNFRSTDVKINAYSEMNPQAARAACLVAFGNVRGPYTVRGGGKVYRVTKGKARKVGR